MQILVWLALIVPDKTRFHLLNPIIPNSACFSLLKNALNRLRVRFANMLHS